MDGVIHPEDDSLVSQFLGIAVGQTSESARHYLQASGWNLERALELCFGGEAWNPASASDDNTWSDHVEQDPLYSEVEEEEEEETERNNGWDDPFCSEVVVEEIESTNGCEEGTEGGKNPAAGDGVVVTKNNAVVVGGTGNDPVRGVETHVAHDDTPLNSNLDSLFRPPTNLMFQGNFHRAKDVAGEQNRWLLVNVQSDREFNSHRLNRDTWANETVAGIVGANFLLWQVYDDTESGKKICSFYRIDSSPVVMVIDPITGQKMAYWTGMIQPEDLLEKLLPFMDVNPLDHLSIIANKRPHKESHQAHEFQHNEEDEDLKRALVTPAKDLSIVEVDSEETVEASTPLAYPPLPEEPRGDRSLLCRVAIRLPPCGRRIQRNFLLSDPIQLLWSFCFSELDEEARNRPFQLRQGIPGHSKLLEYHTSLTFKESGLANSIISVTLG